jgi:hypothetical protein
VSFGSRWKGGDKVRRKSKVAKAKAEELREAVYDRVKEWPERMDYAQLDELALALGCELFADGLPVFAFRDNPKPIDFLSLAYQAQSKAKAFVKARGFVFPYGGANDYRNTTNVSAEVVARWKSEKAERIKSENAKSEAETNLWWAKLAPNLKASLEEAQRSNPRRRFDSM